MNFFCVRRFTMKGPQRGQGSRSAQRPHDHPAIAKTLRQRNSNLAPN